MGHVGIDLAWNTRARTGLAVVDGSGALVDSASVRTDDEIDARLGRHSPSVVNVAIDAPLIVTNETGMRAAEKLIGASFGGYDAGCHASNTSKTYMNPPRATTIGLRHGWNVDAAHVGSTRAAACIEVYPHPAMIGLFGLGRVLKYKRGDLTTRHAAFSTLLDHLEAIPTLSLGTNERWSEIRSVASTSPRQCVLDRIEDEVDAILCAHLAWLWHHRPSTLQVYGDVETGYIVAPPPPTHAPTARAFVAKPAAPHPAKPLPTVTFCVDAVPATFATAGERPWRRAVEEAAIAAIGTSPDFHSRFSVQIDFVLPAPTTKVQGWDLDNLIKPTFDALGRSSASVQATGARSQPDDERADRFVATKRTVKNGETPG